MEDTEFGSASPTRVAGTDRTLAARSEAGAQRHWVPGEVGIWAFIFTDLVTFSAYFISFMYEQGRHRMQFSRGSAELDTMLGAANTILLLTASLFIALTVHSVRRAASRAAQRFLLGAGACGSIFIMNKVLEWSTQSANGHTPHDGVFFQMYYMLTGMHLLHVLIAMVVLGYLWRLTRQVTHPPTEKQMRLLENGASFWHLTDALWLVLFTLFYLAN
ncbi:heme-copper oxidase subunit III [Streptomyces sp. NPDC059874]|uniref:cytochrome c oxidase subunit 3 n=1 Tax=Streptomyces sp. NPDC059874 TaxID=3346983 RepID=UPI0036646879